MSRYGAIAPSLVNAINTGVSLASLRSLVFATIVGNIGVSLASLRSLVGGGIMLGKRGRGRGGFAPIYYSQASLARGELALSCCRMLDQIDDHFGQTKLVNPK